MQLISPSLGPLDVSEASQVLSDTKADFAVIGLCSAESSGEAGAVAALGGLLSGQHQQAAPAAALQGLKMHVHPRDRLIVLDASHILSADVLSALLAPDRPQPAVGLAAAATVRAAASRAGSSSTLPVEGVASLLSLQMVTLLLAVCNVVVVGATDFDLHLLQLLEACCLITSSIPDLAVPQAALQQQQQAVRQPGQAAPRRGRGQQQQQQQRPGSVDRHGSSSSKRQRQLQASAAIPHHLADLVLLQSCSSTMQLAGNHVMQLQQLVGACLSGTEWAARPRQVSGLKQTTAAAAAAAGDRQQDMQLSSSSGAEGINIWMTPAIHSSSSSSSSSNSGAATTTPEGGAGVQHHQQQQQQQQVPAQLRQLANRLLALPRTITAASSAGGSSNGCFSRPLTEKDWLRGVQRVWEAVQDSNELLQYYGLAAVARYTGAGGWRQR